MSTLKRLAEDLDSFLAGIAKSALPSSPTTVSFNGSGQIQTDAASSKSVDEVVRATFDYVTSQLKEEDGAEAIGQTFMVACDAIAKDAGLDHGKVQLHALAFLEGIVEAARGSL